MASIPKRGNTWRVRIRRKGYPTRTASFDDKSDAEEWALKIEKHKCSNRSKCISGLSSLH